MVYIIHFESSIAHACHYIGSTKNLKKRMAEHEKGTTTPLMREVKGRGIKWRVSIVDRQGMKQRERQIKSRGSAKRTCPICQGKGRGGKYHG